MRLFATLLCLFVLCLTSAVAQTNPAQDPGSTLTQQTVALYDAKATSTGVDVYLKAQEGNISDEVLIWRTGSGSTAYTVSDARVYDPTLVNLPTPAALEAQCRAAVLKGIASGLQLRPSTNVIQTKVWFNYDGTDRSMNFEIRWDSKGATTVTRLPDDVVSGTVN